MAILNIKNLPDGLYERLRQRARRQRRSISGEVVSILEKALDEGIELSLLDLKGLGKETWSTIDAVEHVAKERDAWD